LPVVQWHGRWRHARWFETDVNGKLGGVRARSFPLPRPSAWPPHKEVFEEDATLARGKQRVALQAGNLPLRHVTRSLDADDPILCLAAWVAEENGL